MFDVIHWTSITVYIHIKCMLKNCIQRCDMSIYILIITRKSIYKCIYTYQIYCVFISPYFVWICSHHFPFGNILHPKSIPSEKPPPSALQLLVGVKLWSSDFGFSVSPHFVVPFSLGMMPRSVNTYIYTHFWGVEKIAADSSMWDHLNKNSDTRHPYWRHEMAWTAPGGWVSFHRGIRDGLGHQNRHS